ncbi:NAD(P)-dependent oxidoreductase [Priestia koreensis]|uniref:NAD(P)-dependent oxidoreductase n=1 Tax=Priestia koreensis TaxID=284581 RepID=UPI003458DA95
MNIALLGATGRVGSEILSLALPNHRVKALVRDSSKVTKGNHPHLTLTEGNALNKLDLIKTIKNADVVISALNTDGENVLSETMPLIIESMKQHDVKRLITIGTAGILQSRTEPHLYRFQSSESKRRSTRAAEDHLKAYLMLQESDLHWTIVCPTYLPDGERTETYRFEKDVLPEGGVKITVGDTADFAYKQLHDSSFIGSRVGLSY